MALIFFWHGFTFARRRDYVIAAQWDGLTIDQHYLRSGDVLVQVHFIGLPPDFPVGNSRSQLGMYSTRTLQRVPIELDGQPVTEQILLQAVEVKN